MEDCDGDKGWEGRQEGQGDGGLFEHLGRTIRLRVRDMSGLDLFGLHLQSFSHSLFCQKSTLSLNK